MAIQLPDPITKQQQSNWCWAGSAASIVDFYGGNASQCNMATYLEEANGWGSVNCCNFPAWNGSGTDTTPSYCNTGNYFATQPGNVQTILQKMYGIPTNDVLRPLAASEVETEVYAGRPFEFAWAWTQGGGHAQVGNGWLSNSSTMGYFDPWPSDPSENWYLYSWVVQGSNHTWVETLKPTITPNPPVPVIYANGKSGNVSVSSSTPVNITAGLNAGGFTNTQADWWVAAYLNGDFYFLNSSEQWTTQELPVIQGAIFSFAPVSFFNSALPSGTTITFYFGVDLTMDGVLDNPVYWNSVTVTSH
jgi:hypothetical protein